MISIPDIEDLGKRALRSLPGPNAAAREPLTRQSFVKLVVPVFLIYYLTAVLVLLPHSFANKFIRLSLLPVSLWLAYSAATGIDVTLAYDEPRLNYCNQALIVVVTGIALRVVDWTFQKSPLTRLSPGGEESQPKRVSTFRLFGDALDLVFNLRGIGWRWSRSAYIPPSPWPNPRSKPEFVLTSLFTSILRFVVFDCIQYSIQVSYPLLADHRGASLFDPSLPPLARYLKAWLICIGTGFIIYHGLQAWYQQAAIVGVLVFQHDHAQWPPLFDEPWKATSLADFWGRRWHQILRRGFLTVGSKPLRKVFGRVGGVMGAFLVSALLHDWATWGMGRGGEFWSVGGFFLMNGAGVVAEELWRKITGRQVRGWPGWVWTMAWLVGWASVLVDAWARRGTGSSCGGNNLGQG
ncbi:hypothetical protein OE88DRAFT_1668739 [Heliocybe sulcata]|uniref:Wax synthase domain-containing protein n=1 Tax=Heliocybe sulcata TaxID=5364 RepID=A0A5C3MKS1_9AGAM|nr:hypothetical protein OE88DRAFT_1668739 [Heliocybe sulcata]